MTPDCFLPPNCTILLRESALRLVRCPPPAQHTLPRCYRAVKFSSRAAPLGTILLVRANFTIPILEHGQTLGHLSCLALSTLQRSYRTVRCSWPAETTYCHRRSCTIRPRENGR